MMSNSRLVSRTVSDVVGSSKMMSRLSSWSALAISDQLAFAGRQRLHERVR